MHFSQFVKCISLRRLLFGVIWLKVSYNRGPRHPPTTVHPNCFTPLYPLSSSKPPKPSPLQPPSYPWKPFNINSALKNWKTIFVTLEQGWSWWRSCFQQSHNSQLYWGGWAVGLSRITFPWKRKRARKSIVGPILGTCTAFFGEFILHEIFSVNGSVDKPV